MARGPGIASERADTLHRTRLVHAPVMAVEQVGVRREERKHFRKATRGKAIVAADARALLEMNLRETVRSEYSICDLQRFLEAHWPAQPMAANLQEDLVGDVVVRGSKQLDEDP